MSEGHLLRKAKVRSLGESGKGSDQVGPVCEHKASLSVTGELPSFLE